MSQIISYLENYQAKFKVKVAQAVQLQLISDKAASYLTEKSSDDSKTNLEGVEVEFDLSQSFRAISMNPENKLNVNLASAISHVVIPRPVSSPSPYSPSNSREKETYSGGC